jgi:hypothetical protein
MASRATLATATAVAVAAVAGCCALYRARARMAELEGRVRFLAGDAESHRQMLTRDTQKCKVFLVGAGHGSTGLLTMRAYALLSVAEVLIVDNLVDEDMLSIVPRGCEVIDVSKRGGVASSTPQSEINTLLLKHALADRVVVRLKGGDPMVSADALNALTRLHVPNAFLTNTCTRRLLSPGVRARMGGDGSAEELRCGVRDCAGHFFDPGGPGCGGHPTH